MKKFYLQWLYDQIEYCKDMEANNASSSTPVKDTEMAWRYTRWAFEKAKDEYVRGVVIHYAARWIGSFLMNMAMSLAFFWIFHLIRK